MKPLTLTLLVLFSASTACTFASAPSAPETAPTTAPVLPSPTALPPVAHVGGSVPCFANADIEAPVLTTVEIGDEQEIVGQARARKFWVVQPEEIDGYCWVESEYVTVQGETTGIAHLVPTLTPPPAAPANFRAEKLCEVERTSFSRSRAAYALLQWDPVSNADGYSLFRNGEWLIDIPADQTSYIAFIALIPPREGFATFQIEAFGDSGVSKRVELEFGYQCDDSDYK